MRLLFQPGQVAVQLHVWDDFRYKGFPAGLILGQRLRPLIFQHMIFPLFIVQVKFLIAPDMLDQGTVPVAKILPPGIAVGLALECKVNAEVGFIVVAAALVFGVQLGKEGVGLMQRHLLAGFQMGAFAEQDRHNRLRCRVKGRFFGLRLRRLAGPGPLQRPVVREDKALCLNGVQRALRHLAGGFHIGVDQGLQHGFHTVGHFLLLFRGQLGKHTVRCWLLGGLRLFLRRCLFLLGLPLFLKLGKVAVNGGNQFMGGGPDGFKGRFQLF